MTRAQKKIDQKALRHYEQAFESNNTIALMFWVFVLVKSPLIFFLLIHCS